MPIVNIPGVGNVKFPDDMSPEAISEAAGRLHQQASPMPESAMPQPTYGTGLASQVGQGAGFGFMDEIRGLAGAAMAQMQRGGSAEDAMRRYRSHRDLARSEMSAFEAENPKAALAANLGGGLLSGLATGGAAATTGIGRSGARALSRLSTPERLLAAAPIGAATGAAGGALAGAGEAEELSDIPGEVGRGAAAGAALGTVAGPLAEGVVTAGQGLLGALARPFTSEARGRGMVRRAIENQGGPQMAAGRAAALGPGAALADTGEQTLALLDSLASQPGRTGPEAGRLLAQRSRRQIGELTEAIGEGRAAEALEATASVRSNQASPIYERAYAAGVEHNDTLEEIFETVEGLVPSVWSKAKRFGAAELRNTGRQELAAELGDARPSLRGWQFIKRRIDDAVGAAKRAGNNDEARVLAATRRRLLSELDRQSPDYAAARQIWAGAESFDEAVTAGQRFIREPSSATVETLKGLSDIDREGYKIGAIQAIQDMLESQGWTHDATKRFRTPRMERKLRNLLGAEDFADFMNRLEASRVKQATFGKVGKGSDTARRMAFQTDQGMAAALADYGADVLSSGSTTLPLMARAARAARGVAGAPAGARDVAGEMLLSDDIMESIRRAYEPMPPAIAKGGGLLPAVGAIPVGGFGAGLLPPENR